MHASGVSPTDEPSWLERRRRALRTVTPVAGLVVVPLVLWSFLAMVIVQEDTLAVDFHTYYADGEAVLEGRRPASPYPPLISLLIAPLAALPRDVADLLWTGVMVACAAGTLWALDVRDWRCYGAMTLWAPVFSGVQSGNVTLPLALGVALLYRWRDRQSLAGAVAVLVIVLKLFLWPLGLWLLATGRRTAVAVAAVLSAVAVAVAWVAIDFGSIETFLDGLEGAVGGFGQRAYTIVAVLEDAGASSSLAYGVTWAVGGVLLVLAVRLAMAGDEIASLTLFLTAALVLSPVVWLHYLSLLLVPVALARPRFSGLWLVPLPLWFCPVVGASTPEKLFLFAVTGVLVAAVVSRTRATGAGASGRRRPGAPRRAGSSGGGLPASR